MSDDVFNAVVSNYDEDGFPKARKRRKIVEEESPVDFFSLAQNGEKSTTYTGENDTKKTTDVAIFIGQLLESEEVSPAEELFIDIYTSTLSKTQAMREAFPEIDEKQYRKYANKLLEKPAIKKEVGIQVEKILNSDVARAPALLLKETERALDYDLLDFYTEDGDARPLNEIDPDKRKLIASITYITNNKTGIIKPVYNLISKEKSLDRLNSIVELLTKTRAAIGPGDGDPGQESARAMRDKIFNQVDESEKEAEPVVAPKRKRGRPKKED